MRIKLRCPHCGDWFTLTFVIEEGEVEARASDVGESEKPERPKNRPPSPARLTRGRLIAAICVVAAVVIVWALVGTLSNRETGRSSADAVSALSTDADAAGARVPEGHPPGPEPAAASERGVLELELLASERCWIRVRADGVVVADATLNAGERRSWRADGFFELDVGAGDAVRLYLNGDDLGTAGAGPRVVEGLRITEGGIRGR